MGRKQLFMPVDVKIYWLLMKGDISIFYHSGGGKHGGSYYGISSGTTGK